MTQTHTATHTPGPWHVGDNMGDRRGIYREGGNGAYGLVATVETRHTTDKLQWKADARLIASAPALLAALESIEEMCQDIAPNFDDDSDYARILRLIQPAIANAKGQA